MRRRFLWSVTLAGLIACSVALGIALTVGDSVSVTAATHPPVLHPATTTTAETTTPTTPTTTTTTRPNTPEVDAGPAHTTTTTLPAGTLTEGSPAADVTELRRQLNTVTETALELNGVYDDGVRAAVRTFQNLIGVAATGVADPVTRWALAEAATRAARWTIDGDIDDGCKVAVIGDSLVAGAEELYVDALARIGCAATVDGEGSRSLSYGWQCRVGRSGLRPQLWLFDERIRGNNTCAPSGLTLLASWAGAARLGDVVVVGLGTNDSGLYDESRRQRNWSEALRLAGGRTVVFLTTQARAGSTQERRQGAYSETLRQWCAGHELCVLADWATAAAAADPASYVDSVHLNVEGTRARAEFVSEVVATLLPG